MEIAIDDYFGERLWVHLCISLIWNFVTNDCEREKGKVYGTIHLVLSAKGIPRSIERRSKCQIGKDGTTNY